MGGSTNDPPILYLQMTTLLLQHPDHPDEHVGQQEVSDDAAQEERPPAGYLPWRGFPGLVRRGHYPRVAGYVARPLIAAEQENGFDEEYNGEHIPQVKPPGSRFVPIVANHPQLANPLADALAIDEILAQEKGKHDGQLDLVADEIMDVCFKQMIENDVKKHPNKQHHGHIDAQCLPPRFTLTFHNDTIKRVILLFGLVFVNYFLSLFKSKELERSKKVCRVKRCYKGSFSSLPRKRQTVQKAADILTICLKPYLRYVYPLSGYRPRQMQQLLLHHLN